MRIKLTQTLVESTKAAAGAERTIFWDEKQPGFGLMVTEAGAKSFVCQYRANGISRRMTFKAELGVERARREARMVLGKVASGSDPLGEKRKDELAAKNSLRSICEEYQKREGGKLRTAEWRRQVLERLVYPTLGSRQIDEIKRTDIVRLLDKIQDERGPVMADRTLGILSRVMNWHAGRSDDFRSPIVRGMARTKNSERARDRILTDDEIRALWKASDDPAGPFPALVRFLLLTGARRSEASGMAWNELQGLDWTLPASRNKTKQEFVRPLSSAAMSVLAMLPKIGEFVFSTGRGGPYTDFGHAKARFDKACGVTGWTLHDLRRTARSLMSRAGVSTDHAEIALGHKLGGVRGVYDRHEYHQEKQRAFEALASQIEHILKR